MQKPINIFIIYAREDKEIKQGILSYLSPFVKPYNLVIWHDAHIEPGQEWKHSIDSRLNETDLFLLLVSIDFMNSHFIHQVEFKYAVERHRENKSIIIPVITRECPWNFVDFEFDEYKFNLSELQVLPEDGKPIADWKTPDQAYNNIATGIRKVFSSISKNQELQESIEKNKEESKKTQDELDLKKIEDDEKQKQIDNAEESLWLQLMEESSVEGYQKYLNQFPAGRYKNVALAAIKTLENISKREQKKEEEILWKSSCDVNTIVSYRDYLDNTKLGIYRENANKLISELETINREILAEKGQQLMREQDNKLWNNALDSNTVLSYKMYLIETKSGLFKENAERAIEQLETEQIEREKEQEFWLKAKTEDTVNIYNEYLQLYPNGVHSKEASIAQKDIERKNFEILAEKESNLKAEQDTKIWKETELANTISSYKKYLSESSLGLFKDKAQHAIEQLEAEQLEKLRESQFWQKAKTENTIEIYNEYLQNFPKGAYRAEASSAITAIESADRQQEEIQLKREDKATEQIKRKGTSKTYIYLLAGFVLIAAVVFGIIQMNSSKNNEKVSTQGTGPVLNIAESKIVPVDSSKQFKANPVDSIKKVEVLTVGQKYEGGIIVKLPEAGKPGLIVAENDLKGLFNWKDANQKCKDLGDGWRLPDKSELAFLYANSPTIGNFKGKDYWSSTETTQYKANHFVFSQNGYMGNNTKSALYSVRAVREY